jgi:hypothetical protein
VAAFLGFEWLQETLSPPVSLPVIFVAVVLARLGLVAGRVRAHYLWIAAAAALFGVLPRAAVSADIRAVAGNLLIGCGLVVAAIGDDRMLRRTLRMRRSDSSRRAAL